jgi:hypothetical protein
MPLMPPRQVFQPRLLLLLGLGLLIALSGCKELEETAIIDRAHEIAMRYVRAQKGSSSSAPISISLQDLNQDGRVDAIVRIQNERAVCTAQGCTMLVLENRGSDLRPIGIIRNVHAHIGQRPGTTDWPTLLVTSKDANGDQAVQVYALEFEKGYPADATAGEPTSR